VLRIQGCFSWFVSNGFAKWWLRRGGLVRARLRWKRYAVEYFFPTPDTLGELRYSPPQMR
jgi:hypothetical protein